MDKQYRMTFEGDNGPVTFEADTQEELRDQIQSAANQQAQQTAQLRDQLAQYEPQVEGEGYFKKMNKETNNEWFRENFGMTPQEAKQSIEWQARVSAEANFAMVNAKVGKGHPELMNLAPEDDLKNAQRILQTVIDNGWSYDVPRVEMAIIQAREKGQLVISQGSPENPDVPVTMPLVKSEGVAANPEEEKRFLATAPTEKIAEYFEKKKYPSMAR
jgi:hypothetical protein